MRIIFVRHGEPDYEHDCLTPTGWEQARAAAERLAGEGISALYASPFGRAQQTARCAARRLGLPVTTLDFMHEITWGGEGVPADGHPWTLGDRMMAEGVDFAETPWQEHPWFKTNLARQEYLRVSRAFDEFLLGLGYRHEGLRFSCERENRDTVALFSHGGSCGIVLSHLLNLPFPYVCSVLPFYFTSLIILDFPAKEGEWMFPRLELFNDIGHLRRRPAAPVLQETPDIQ